MKTVLSALSLLLLCSLTPAQAPREAAPPTAFDKYHMVFLMRPEPARDYGAARNAELQRQHLGHLAWLVEQGYAFVAGPFDAGDDDAMRGIVLFDGGLAPGRVRELAEMDPRVQAGQLRIEIRDWYTEAGAVAFPKAQATPQAQVTP